MWSMVLEAPVGMDSDPNMELDPNPNPDPEERRRAGGNRTASGKVSPSRGVPGLSCRGKQRI